MPKYREEKTYHKHTYERASAISGAPLIYQEKNLF